MQMNNENPMSQYGFSLLAAEMSEALIKYGARLILADPLMVKLNNQINNVEMGTSINERVVYEGPIRSDMLNQIKSEQILEKTLVPAMLATELKSVKNEYLEFHQLQAFVYWASTFVNDTAGVEIVGKAAREVRLLATETSRAKFWREFSCEISGLKGLTERLIEFDDKEKYPGIYIGHIVRLIHLVEERLNPKETPNINKKKTSIVHGLKMYRASARLTDDDFDVDVLANINKDRYSDEAGSEVSQTTKWVIVKPKTNSEFNRDRALKYLQANALINEFSMREVLPATRYGSLTANEIRELVLTIHAGVMRNEIAYILLAIMLLFGRNLNRAIAILKKIKGSDEVLWESKDVCALKYTMHLPIVKASLYGDLESIENDNCLLLPLPIWLSQSLLTDKSRKKLNLTNAISEVERVIRELNIKANNRFTKTAIANVAFEWLRRSGRSESDALWLVGATPQDYASLYYYAVPETRLRMIHQKYLMGLERLSDISMVPVTINESKKILGSRIVISVKSVEKIVQDVFGDRYVLKSRSKEDLVEFHNNFIWKCYFVFALFTAHRAVENPFQNIKDFDCVAQTLWVCDKDNRSVQSSRIVPLASVVVEQYQHLVTHYKALARWLSPIDEGLAEGIDGILVGEKDSFLLSRINQDKLIGISPSQIEYHFKKIYHLPTNWQRHFLRQYLNDCNHPQDEINAFMGHANFGREAHGRWSAYGPESSRSIIKSLNKLAVSLKIQSVKGLC